MILEDATYEAFLYYPSKLKHKSCKPIIAACELCGKIRILKRKDYHTLCSSCTKKGNSNLNFRKHFSKDHKAKLSESHKAGKNGMFGKNAEAHHFFGKKHSKKSRALIGVSLKGNKNHFGSKNTEETKALMSAKKKGELHPNFGRRGKDANGYKGGKKICKARSNAKRRRQLGFNLLMPLAEGEAGHHVTNEHVIGIPVEVHKRRSGGGRQKHRLKVLQWLKDNDERKYDLVLSLLAGGSFI